MEAGATVQKCNQDWRSHEDLYHSERLCGSGPSCHGELTASMPHLMITESWVAVTDSSLQQCQRLGCILWALLRENIIKCTLLWSIPVWFAYTEGCFGLFSKWILFWAECDLVLLTVSWLMSPFCVVLLCSGVHYVVILSKQLLHVLLF